MVKQHFREPAAMETNLSVALPVYGFLTSYFKANETAKRQPDIRRASETGEESIIAIGTLHQTLSRSSSSTSFSWSQACDQLHLSITLAVRGLRGGVGFSARSPRWSLVEGLHGGSAGAYGGPTRAVVQLLWRLGRAWNHL